MSDPALYIKVFILTILASGVALWLASIDVNEPPTPPDEEDGSIWRD